MMYVHCRDCSTARQPDAIAVRWDGSRAEVVCENHEPEKLVVAWDLYVPRCCYSCDLREAIAAEEARRARAAALPADALEEAALELRSFTAQYAPHHLCGGEYDGTVELYGGKPCPACQLCADYDAALAASRARRAEMRPVRRLVRCPGCGFADENGIGVFCHGHEPPIPMVHYVEERRS